ncbi:MAG: MBOAT family O-acyltransferase [Chloroflexota bacterium]
MTGWWLLPRRVRLWWLLGASLVFYATWNVLYVPGFLLLILVNFVLGLAAAGPYRRAAVATAVTIDLVLLGLFKYLDWAIGSGASIVAVITGRQVHLGGLGLILPLAISFVTFTLVAYVVDVGRGRAPERNPLRFAVFIGQFPNLVAGPILRGRELLPQLRHLRPFRATYVGDAVPLLLGGLLKKSLADLFAPGVQQAFADPGRQSSAALLVGAVAFTFQLYLDFSGYTDIALGSARLMGFRLPRNFDWPYRSTNMAEFWKHWHITLGRWLRDYLYFPLGGSRKGQPRAYLNLLITMTLCGLWHGAGLTFIVWGFLQGVALCAYRFWRRRPGVPRMPLLVGWAVTFTFVVLVRVFFAAPDIGDALAYLRDLVTFQDGAAPEPLMVLACVLGILGQLPVLERSFRRVVPRHSVGRWASYGAMAGLVILLLPVQGAPFIYARF